MFKNSFLYFLLFLIIFSFSCNGQSPAKPNLSKKEIPSIKEKSSDNNKSTYLKYTSGCWAILHDSKGNYWFGSHQEGVCLFDGKSFTYFTIEDGLSDNQVRSIQEDDNGTIWFGTANGVCSYDGDSIKKHIPKSRIITDDVLGNNWKLSKTDLWFNAGNQPGVYRWDGKELSYLAFPIPEDKTNFRHYGVTGFLKSKSGYLWIATYSAVFGYDGKSFKIIDDDFMDFKAQEGPLHVRSILEDSKGNLWIGNNGIGVLLDNGIGGLINDGSTVINFSDKHGLIHANTSQSGGYSPAGTLEHIFAIAEDKDGNIWFGDRDTGAWKYDGKSMTNYIIDNNKKEKLPPSIYKDKNGNLLFGLASGGVYQFNGKSFERKY